MELTKEEEEDLKRGVSMQVCWMSKRGDFSYRRRPTFWRRKVTSAGRLVRRSDRPNINQQDGVSADHFGAKQPPQANLSARLVWK